MDELASPLEAHWVFRTLEHARRPREKTRYVIDKFFATHTLNILYGAPGSLKSMVALDMALDVAGGIEWMPGCMQNGEGAKTEQGAVVWVDMDNGRRRSDERVDAMSRMKPLPHDAPFYYISMPQPQLIAHDIESMTMLRNSVDSFGAVMVVIDNLGLVTGEVEENSAAMAQVMKNFRWLAEETGAAVLLLHHQRKGSTNGGRVGDSLRGHSSIEASLDLALQVTREDKTNQITIRSTKTRGVDVPMVVTSFKYEHVEDSNDLKTAWFEVLANKVTNDTLRHTIRHIVDGNGVITKTKLVQLVYADIGKSFSYQDIRAEVDTMLHATGDLALTEGKQNRKIITLGRKK